MGTSLGRFKRGVMKLDRKEDESNESSNKSRKVTLLETDGAAEVGPQWPQ